MQGEDITISKGSSDIITLFGLTSLNTSGVSVIKDINFYSATDAASTYSVLSFLSEGDHDTSKDSQLLLKGATTNAQGAIKHLYNGSFAFLELINSSFSTNDYKAYELNLFTPTSSSPLFRFEVNGWDGQGPRYEFVQNDQVITGSFIATSNNGMDFAYANKTINNLWIQYLYGDGEPLVDINSFNLIKNDDSKEVTTYNLSASNISIYHAKFIATAADQYICNMTNVSVAGYDYIRIELNQEASAGWKIAYDGKVKSITPGETSIIIPIESDYSTIQSLSIYTDTDSYPSDIDIAGVYLTNESGEPPVVVDPNDSYFPLTNSGVDLTIWNDGGNLPNFFDEATKTFTFGSNYNSVGWSYPSSVVF